MLDANGNSWKFRTKDDFLVKIAKGSGVIEFTQEHLALHLSMFNPETKPEYFGDIMHLGLNYVRTGFLEASDIDKLIQGGGMQFFRKGSNPEHPKIKNSMMRGYDLREKPLQVVLDENGKPQFLFNGNTTHDIFNDYTNLQNRLVAFYTKNEYFNIANLRLIGAYSNTLDYPSGLLKFHDIKKIVKEYLIDAQYFEQFKNNLIDREFFIKVINDKINLIAGTRFNTDINDVYDFITDTIQEATGQEELIKAGTGIKVMERLRNMNEIEYSDRSNNHFVAMTSNADKITSTLSTKDLSLFDLYENNEIKVHPDDIMISLIIHMGSPNPSDPVKDFFKKYLEFYFDYLKQYERFIKQRYIINGSLRGNHKLIGAYQQVMELNDIFPFGTVITFDQIIKEYEKRVPEAIVLKNIKEIKSRIELDK